MSPIKQAERTGGDDDEDEEEEEGGEAETSAKAGG